MINIAIVDDETKELDNVSSFIKKYETENSLFENEFHFMIKKFTSPREFLSSIDNFDLIFLDIEMPEIDGMTLAKKIRNINPDVILVFITNMAQYAINGYEVSAVDFIVKPLNYNDFYLKFTKILAFVKKNLNNQISLKSSDGKILISNTKDIFYIESNGHYLSYKLENEEIIVRETMSDCEKKLLNLGFARCSKSYIVNLKNIEQIKGSIIVLKNKQEIYISRSMKTKFMLLFTNYIGGIN